MNNLHRELAPISDAAWAQIEEETSRTIKRYLAGRRVVDVHGPAGAALSAVGTGHLRTIAAPAEDITAQQREAKALVELRVPFELDRQMIDDVERGANDSDWQPAKDAARKLAFAEDVSRRVSPLARAPIGSSGRPWSAEQKNERRGSGWAPRATQPNAYLPRGTPRCLCGPCAKNFLFFSTSGRSRESEIRSSPCFPFPPGVRRLSI